MLFFPIVMLFYLWAQPTDRLLDLHAVWILLTSLGALLDDISQVPLQLGI